MREPEDHSKFLYPSDVLPYNAHLHFINSGRGLRKTHNYLRWCCDRFIKHGEQFAYTRRTKTEIDDNAYLMFSGLEKYGDFPAGSFRVVGDKILFNRRIYEAGGLQEIETTKPVQRDKRFKVSAKDAIKEGDEIAGFLFAVSTAGTKKSTAYPNVQNFIFDEYLQESGNKIKGEVERFLSLMETVFRDRPEMRMFLLGNTTTANNPYYQALNVEENTAGNEITFFRHRGILIQKATREAFKEFKLTTPVGRILNGTKYGRHVLDNVSIKDDLTNIMVVKSPKKYRRCNVIYEGKEFALWTFPYCGDEWLYIDDSTKGQNTFYNLDAALYPNKDLVSISVGRFRGLFTDYFMQTGSVFFKDLIIKDAILPALF